MGEFDDLISAVNTSETGAVSPADFVRQYGARKAREASSQANSEVGEFDDLILAAKQARSKAPVPEVNGGVKQFVLGNADSYGEGSGSLVAGTGEFLQAPSANTLAGLAGLRAFALKALVGSDIANRHPDFAGVREEAQKASDFARTQRAQNVAEGNLLAVAGLGQEAMGKEAQQKWAQDKSSDSPMMVDQSQAIENAKGFVGKSAAMLSNPIGTIGSVFQSLPDMVVGMGAGSLAAKTVARMGIGAAEAVAGRAAVIEAGMKTATFAEREALVSGASAAEASAAGAAAGKKAIIDAAGTHSAGTAGLVSEVVSSAMHNKQQVTDFVLQQQHEALAKNSPRYRELLASNTPDEARAKLAEESGHESSMAAGIWNGVMNKLTGSADAIGKTVATGKTTGKEALTGIGKESLQEATQNPGENYAQHQAQVQVDPTQKYDFGGSVAEGVISGAAMGAGPHGAGYVGGKWADRGTAAAPVPPGDAPNKEVSPSSTDNSFNAADILGTPTEPSSAATAPSEADKALFEPKSLTALDRVSEIDAKLPTATAEESSALQAERDSITASWPKATPGSQTTFSTETGARLSAQYALMEAGDLTSSHDENLRPTPTYPSELQPRERERAASEMQVSSIMQKLDPARLGESADAASGAPIVGADGLVESGNARTIALKRVYQANGKKAADYKQFLKDSASRLGFAPESVDAMQKPVLVRVRTTPVNRAEFARQANASTVAQMSPSEQARSDAARIDNIDDLTPDDSGDFMSGTSRGFVRRFLAKLPGTEQAGMIDANGELSQSGYTRIRNAVLAKAYGDSPVLLRMVESLDDNTRNLSKALIRVAPQVAKVRESISEGALHDVDITPDLMAAVEELSELKDKGVSVEQSLAQSGMFGDKLTPESRVLLAFLNDNIRSPRRIAEFIQAYLDALTAAGNPAQGSMFGDSAAPAKSDLLNAARRTTNADQTATAGRTDASDTATTEDRGRQSQDAPGNQAGNGRHEAAGRDAATEVGTPSDRRSDEAQRKTVGQMTEEEVRHALLTDDLTGLGNRRAYDESEKLPVQVSIDVDALKWVNDNMGHGAGDTMLKAVGVAIRRATLDGYHVSGDEYYVQANSKKDADAIMQRVRVLLEEATFNVHTEAGGTITKNGVGVSYGTGKTLEEAEHELHRDKAAREVSGFRSSRGAEPSGVVRKSASGEQTGQRDISGLGNEVARIGQQGDHAEVSNANEGEQAAADFKDALDDLGEITAKFANVARVVPEDTPGLRDTLVKLFDAAMRLGYHDAKKAVAYVKEQLKADPRFKTVWNKIQQTTYLKAARQAVDSFDADVKNATPTRGDQFENKQPIWQKEKPLGSSIGPNFSRGASQVVTDPMSIGQLTQTVEEFIDQLAHKPPIIFVDDANDIPGTVAESDVRGAVQGGKIFIVRTAFHRGDTASVVQTLWHELLHYGLRRFLTEDEYTAQMQSLFEKDAWIRQYALKWMAESGNAKSMRAKGQSERYIRARGVDEALAHLGERVGDTSNGFNHNNTMARAYRSVTTWLAGIADTLGFHDTGRWLRSRTSAEAREYVHGIFMKVKSNEAATSSDWGFTAESAFSSRRNWYYSQLSDKLDQAPLKSLNTGKQWDTWVRGDKLLQLGVKKDEIEWSGLTDYLAMRGKEKTTIDDIRTFLAENGVQVKDVVLDTPKFAQYVLPGGENYKELLITLPAKRQWINGSPVTDEDLSTQHGRDAADRTASYVGDTFKSSHFDQPNILAHIRMNERTDADGKRVLFIEEIQSDWGQTAKKNGLKLTEAEGILANTPAKTAAEYAIQQDLIHRGAVGVPSAPFVTDTKAWTGLALKRAIAYAVDNGFDKIAWTNGDQQADRYDLSKQVSEINYSANDDDTYFVEVRGMNREKLWSDRNATASALEDVVGKEIVQKIEQNVGDGQLSGSGLKVGGEGMKAYYDQIVHQVAKKLGAEVGAIGIVKDFGGINPKTGNPRGANFKDENRLMQQPGFTLNDKMKEQVEGKGIPLFSRMDRSLSGRLKVDDVRAVVEGFRKAAKNLPAIHVLQDTKDAPRSVQKWLRENDAMHDAAGLFHEGEIYLFASHLTDIEHAQRVFLHEAQHYGLDGLFGNALDESLLYLYQHNGALKMKVNARQRAEPSLSTVRAVEEVIADMAGAGQASKLNGWDKLVATVRHWFRKIGWVGTVSNADVSHLIYRAELYWKRAQTGGYANMKRGKLMRLADDLAAQEKWLDGEAKARGFKNIDDLAEKAYPVFEKLAALWRKKHPTDHALLSRAKTGDMATKDVVGDDSTVRSADDSTSGAASLPRTTGLDKASGTVVADFKNDQPLKAHADYKAAKAGDVMAAARLVQALVKPESIEAAKKEFGDNVIYVPVHAEEASGRNKIPVVLAMHYVEHAGGEIDDGITQINKAYHTGAKAMERLLARAEFSGPVEPGKRYVLVDDVTTMGSTLADLASYIRSQGGEVAGSVLLVNAARSGMMTPVSKTISELEARHGNEIRKLFGIDPSALTWSESQYLLGFRSTDELRNRVVKARQERLNRLSSKERLSESQDSSGAVGSRLSRASTPQTDPVLPQQTPQAKTAVSLWKRWTAQADRVIDNMDSAVNGLGEMPDQAQYLAQRYRALGRIAHIDQIAGNIRKAFKGVTDADKKAIYAYFTTRGADAAGIQNATAKDMAVTTKKYIGTVGDELVKRGLIPEASRDEYRDRYLPRLYLAHLLDDSSWRAIGAGKKVSDQGYLKQRNEELPEEYRKVILGEVTDPSFLAASAIAQPMRDMAILDWLEQVGQHDKWVWPNQMVQWGKQRVSAAWLQAESDSLLARAQLYPDAENKKKAEAIAGDMRKKALAVMADMPREHTDYKRIPDSPRYGRLRGLMVRREIHNDLVGLGQGMPGDVGWAETLLGQGGIGTKVQQVWKTIKVALNPSGQIRNFVSNVVMLQLSGVPLHRIPLLFVRAIREITDNGTHWQAAKKFGVTQATFSNQELFRAKRDLLELESEMKGMSPWLAIKRAAAFVVDIAGDAYQWSESIMKTVKMMDAMGRQGMTDEKAAMEAQKWLFDYSLVNQNIRYLRNAPVGMPFLTYVTKAAPRLVEVAAKHPQRLLPWVILYHSMYAMAMAAFGGSGDDWDKLKKDLPEWLRKKPHAVPLPWRDGDGRIQFTDIGYFFPWSQWAEVGSDLGHGQVMDALSAAGIGGGPVPDVLTAMKTGIDPFTKRPIADPADPPMEQALGIMNYAWNMAAPPFLTANGFLSPVGIFDKQYGGKLVQGITGTTNKFGDEKATTPQAIVSLFGLNLRGVDPDHSRAQELLKMKHDALTVQQKLKQVMQDRSLDADQRQARMDSYQAEIKSRLEKTQKYGNESAVPAFARPIR